jgi:hypothetical protein
MRLLKQSIVIVLVLVSAHIVCATDYEPTTQVFRGHGVSFRYSREMHLSQESFSGIGTILLQSDSAGLVIVSLPSAESPERAIQELLEGFRERCSSLGALCLVLPTTECKRWISGAVRFGVLLPWEVAGVLFKEEIYAFRYNGGTVALGFHYPAEEKEEADSLFAGVTDSLKLHEPAITVPTPTAPTIDPEILKAIEEYEEALKPPPRQTQYSKGSPVPPSYWQHWALMLIRGVILTWGIGLLPPLVLRFVFLRKPMSRNGALALVTVFAFVNIILFFPPRSQSGIRNWGPFTLVAMASYHILRRKAKGRKVGQSRRGDEFRVGRLPGSRRATYVSEEVASLERAVAEQEDAIRNQGQGLWEVFKNYRDAYVNGTGGRDIAQTQEQLLIKRYLMSSSFIAVQYRVEHVDIGRNAGAQSCAALIAALGYDPLAVLKEHSRCEDLWIMSFCEDAPRRSCA